MLATVAAADRPGWLNVMDLGASGSTFQTSGSTLSGSKTVTVAAAGDFHAGQGVLIARCRPRLINATLWGPKRYAHQPLGDAMEVRSRPDVESGNTVFIVDVAPGAQPAFRWCDDLRTWKQEKLPITYDWQPLSHGAEIRFSRRDWTAGATATFTACDQLATVIQKVDGRVLALRDAPTRTVKDAVVRHCDHEALQAAVDRAVAQRCNLFFPPGFYPQSANWRIHHNAIDGCLRPVVLAAHGSQTSLLKDNLITRGEAAAAGPAIDAHGRTRVIGNHVDGYDQPPQSLKPEKSR